MYKAHFETLYYCGLRRGEISGLTWKDIDFNKQYLIVNKKVVAKYLGHTKIDEILNTYSHLFKNQLNEIINIIDKLN